MKRSLKSLSVGLLSAAAVFGLWSATRHDSVASSDPAQIQPPPDQGTAPKAVIAGLGVIEPAGGSIELAPEIPGVIVALRVAEGDRVKKGDVIAELGNTDLKAKVAQAEAQLAIRKADLAKIESGSRLQEVAQAEAKVAELKSGFDLAEADLRRAARLAKSGTISKKGLQVAANARAIALKQLDSAEQALSLIKEGARAEEVAAARAQVALAAEQLAEARAVFDKSIVRASADGTVLRLFRDAGEAVSTQPATPIAEIGDTQNLVVRAQIDEAEIAGLAVGQGAEISAPAFGNRRVTGKITRISPRIGTKIVNSDEPGEKRDSRVLDVIVSLDPTDPIPVDLRVDVFIDPKQRPVDTADASDVIFADWIVRR